MQTVGSLEGHKQVGSIVRAVIETYLQKASWLPDKIVGSLGTDTSMSDILPDREISWLRREISKSIRAKFKVADPPKYSQDGRSPINGDILHIWSTAAADPASEAASWLFNGAPAGIAVKFNLDGVLEPVLNEAPNDPGDLVADLDSFTNHGRIEDNPDALSIIESYVKRGWLGEFDNESDLSRFVQGKPIYNKFACLSKQRTDGTMKHRLILDSKRSGVTDASAKCYKAVLPRMTDLLSGSVSLLSECRPAESVAFLVLDAEDAFWSVPLHPAERKYFCAAVRGRNGNWRHFAFVSTSQGSRGAPLSWSILFGLICRCAGSTLLDEVLPYSSRLEVYVNDPIGVFRGTPAVIRSQICILIISWAVLGVPLALRKGQFGPKVDWIGGTFVASRSAIEASITAARLDELRSLTDAILAANTVTVSRLSTYIGKAQSMASLLFAWRPFVHMLYGALMTDSIGNAKPNERWVKQIRIPLVWIRSFLSGVSGMLTRRLTVDSYLRKGPAVTINTDTSPFGIGAILSVNGAVKSYFGRCDFRSRCEHSGVVQTAILGRPAST